MFIWQRELRLTARRAQTYWVRFSAAFMAGLAVMVALSAAFGAGRNQALVGAGLFFLLAWIALIYCMVAGCILAADSISQERRDGTLDLLRLAGVRGYEIVLGKLAAVALNPIYAVLSILPFLGLSLLYGGVTWGDFVRASLVIPITLVYSICLGLLVSAHSRRGQRTLSGAMLLMLAALILPLSMSLLPVDEAWPRIFSGLSPLHALATSAESSYQASPYQYWWSLSCPLLLALACLGAAARRLNRDSDEPEQAKKDFPRLAVGPFSVLSSSKRKQPIDDESFNPILWQKAGVATFKTRLVWVGMSFFPLGLMGMLLSQWGTGTSLEVLCGVSGLMHLAFKAWLAMDASRRFCEARRQGELELLYITPLSRPLLWQGHLQLMKRRFLAPGLILLGADLMVIFFGLNSFRIGSGSPDFWVLAYMVGVAMFVIDSLALSWLGLWEGLIGRNTTTAFVRSLSKILVFPWLVFAGLVLLISPLVGFEDMIMGVWLFVGSIVVLGFWRRAMDQFEGRFQAGLERGLSHRSDGVW